MIVCNSDTSEDHNHHQMAYQSPSSTFLFQSHQDHHHQHNQSDHFASLLPQHFHGHPAFLMKRSMSFDHKSCDQEGVNGGVGDDELSDDGSQLGEKKKRLNLEQVKTLEKSFELGNKLEPERKLQLAKALGLQPRQVAIWFQNRRARWKTKQLERDYEVLKKQFNSVKADNDTLQAQNKNLLAELMQLKTRDSNERGGIGLKKETDQGSWSNGSDNSSDLNLDISTTCTPVMNSPVSSQLSTKHLFNTSIIRPTGMTPFLNGSAMKMDQVVQDDNLCNMFGTIEDQPGMWTWPEPHHFH